MAGECKSEHVAWSSEKIGKGRKTGKSKKLRNTQSYIASLKAWDMA
jgi:hypothetical protein